MDSCKHYANATKDSAIIMRMYDLQSQYYFSINNNLKAIEASKKYFNYLEASNTLNAYIFANLGKNFLNNNQVDSAIFYFNSGLRFIKKHNIKHNKMFYYKNLQLAYASKGDYERAYFALDSTFQDYKLSTQRIEAEKINDINTKYQTEKKDQAITLLRTTNAFNHKILVQQRWIFVILLALVFSIAFFIYFRNKQKLLQNINQRILAENKQLILEQKTRQNQLNPHFIYNAIANLQGLISSEQKAKANQYLLLLSRQIRDILELNREEYISLDQEIKSLNNYILLQQMRYQDVFGFQIETDDLDLDDVMIPPMIIQPFVENAIEHAFKNLPYMGHLEISFRTHENQLHVSICDNGWGMQVSKEHVPHKTSLSQIITKERLELLFVDAEPEARIEITPNYNDDQRGYKVEIYIPLVLYFN
ncbi:Sensor histidine kinase YpdA [compost metagenome]